MDWLSLGQLLNNGRVCAHYHLSKENLVLTPSSLVWDLEGLVLTLCSQISGLILGLFYPQSHWGFISILILEIILGFNYTHVSAWVCVCVCGWVNYSLVPSHHAVGVMAMSVRTHKVEWWVRAACFQDSVVTSTAGIEHNVEFSTCLSQPHQSAAARCHSGATPTLPAGATPHLLMEMKHPEFTPLKSHSDYRILWKHFVYITLQNRSF